jgi:PmbA protein
MTTSPADLLQSLIEATLKAGADAADARLSDSASLSVEVRKGELESVEREESRGLALRALVGRRQASVSATDLSPAALKALSERVVAMAKLAPEDNIAGWLKRRRSQRIIPTCSSTATTSPKRTSWSVVAGSWKKPRWLSPA